MNITFTPEELEAIGRNDLSGFDHEFSRYELIAAFRQLAGQKREAEQLADDRLDEIIRLEKKLGDMQRSSYEQMQSKIRSLTAISQEREQDRAAFKAQSEKIGVLEGENTALRVRIAELEVEKEELINASVDFQNNVEELKAELKAKNRLIAELRADIKALHDEIDRLH